MCTWFVVQIFKFSVNQEYRKRREFLQLEKVYNFNTLCSLNLVIFPYQGPWATPAKKNCCHEPPKYRNLSRKVFPEQKLLNYICFSNRLYLLRKVIFALVFYNLGASAKKIRYHLSDLWPPKLYLTSEWWCINACLLSTESFTQKIHRFLVSLGHPSTLT